MEFYQEPEVNRLHSVISWIVDLIVAVALAIYVVYAFGERVEMYGGSMNPVLNSGDVVLVNRLAYDLGSPERFDIAVFTNGSSMNIKRIIGLPGETVQITGNTIHIDGRPLTADHDLNLASIAGLAESPIELSQRLFSMYTSTVPITGTITVVLSLAIVHSVSKLITFSTV